MHRLIDAIVIIVWVSILAICGNELAYVLGGSVSLSLPLTAVYVVSYVRGEHRVELSLAGIILLSLILINYVGFLEKSNKMPLIGVVVLFCFLSLVIIGAFVYLAISPFNAESTQAKKRANADMRRLIFENCSLYPILSLVVFCIPTAFPLSSDLKSGALPSAVTSYIPIAAFWLALSFAVTSVALRKTHKGISKFVKRDTVRKSPTRNKVIVGGFGLVLLLGSASEIARGAWALWIDTILLGTLIFTALWSIWKYVFCEKEPQGSSPAQETIAPCANLRTLFGTIFVYAVLGAIYLMCLTILTMQ
jgi:hypothetical protein